nr:MAG TPA: major capsid protein [Bacteriophage sp.]
MTTLQKGTLFPAELEQELFSMVKGHSSLAILSNQEALPFSGKDIFTFEFSNDISIVAEGEAKPVGDAKIGPVKMVPLKVVYGMRVSDEFVFAAEEKKIDYLKKFNDGFAKKLGAGIDKMAFHGINPATGKLSTTIGDNNFDKKITANVVEYDAATADVNIDAAVAQVESAEYRPNGIAISSTMRGAIAGLTANGQRKYPDFAFGGCPKTLGAMRLDANPTVSVKSTDETETKKGADHALVGDFERCFKWGIAKELPLEVIEYGDPDGNGDLKRNNQVYLRSEAYIGWAIMDPKAFARVKVKDTE